MTTFLAGGTHTRTHTHTSNGLQLINAVNPVVCQALAQNCFRGPLLTCALINSKQILNQPYNPEAPRPQGGAYLSDP